MAWTTLNFSYGAILTSTQMNQMYDNFAAMANGDVGAPTIANATSAGNADTVDSYHAAALLAFSNHTGTISAGQVASGIISQAKLNTTTTSQSGSIADGAYETISLSAYSFFPDIEFANALGFGYVLAAINASPSASADSPQFRLRNFNGNSDIYAYSVAWRYVVA